MFEIKLTKLGQTMEEGTVTGWLKKVGERFEVGDPLYECETEKAVTEVEATRAGILREILIGEDDVVPVGTVIARADEAE
ncbi:MAG: biotin attachment protein [Sphingomonadales bacterium]|nr:MAG: biotin attachment protein [Sphingomonadales bacterium]